MMPVTNDKNRDGQNIPLNPNTARSVASMNNHDTGIPIKISKNLYGLYCGHMIDVFI